MATVLRPDPFKGFFLIPALITHILFFYNTLPDSPFFLPQISPIPGSAPSQPPSPFPLHNFRTPSPPQSFSPTAPDLTVQQPFPELPPLTYPSPQFRIPLDPEKHHLPLLLPLSLTPPFPSPRACSCALQVTLAAHTVAHPLPPPAQQRLYHTIHTHLAGCKGGCSCLGLRVRTGGSEKHKVKGR